MGTLRWAGAAAVLGCLMMTTAARADTSAPLEPLRAWGAATAAGRLDAPALERRILALRRVVPVAGRALKRVDADTRARELAATRVSLADSLDPLLFRLQGQRRSFFYLAYQRQLERLGLLALLDRAPTGLLLAVPRSGAAAEQAGEALVQDTDGDGVADAASADDDGDGVPDVTDASDKGWGIPDAFLVRGGGDGDPRHVGTASSAVGPLAASGAALLGAARTGSGYCVWETEGIPNVRTVREARAWQQRAQRRGCAAPAAPSRSTVAVAAAVRRAPKPAARAPRLRVGTATLAGDQLRVRITLSRAARVDLDIRPEGIVRRGNGYVVIARKSLVRRIGLRARAGAQTLQARIAKTVPPGQALLRVTARAGGRKQTRTVPLAVVAPAAVQGASVPPAAPTPVPLPPPAAAPRCDADDDGDGVPNCQETAGFDFALYEPSGTCTTNTSVLPCRVRKVIHVTSDPQNPNTDGDAVTADGQTFALTDGQEWQLFQQGGMSNPSVADSDDDGLGDVEEVYRWGTLTNDPDSDGDSGEASSGLPPDPDLFDGAETRGGARVGVNAITSPTATDSDGDSESDLDEILDGTVNPAIAEVPTFEVTQDPAAPGVVLALRTTEEQRVKLETTTENSTATRREDSRTTKYLTQHKLSITGEAKLEGEIGLGGGAGEKKSARGGGGVGGTIGLSGTITANYEYLTSKETSHTTSFTQESVRRSQQTYTQEFGKTTEPTGSISAAFLVRNTSPYTAIRLKNLRVFASFICLPRPGEAGCLNPQQATLVPQPLVPDASAFPDGIELPAGSSQQLTLRADGVDASLIRQLAANPTNLQLQPAQADLFEAGADQSVAATLGKSLPRSTAKLVIDSGDGNPQSYLVAAANGRAWGKPSAFQSTTVPIADALDLVGAEYSTFANANGSVVLDTLNGLQARAPRSDGIDGAWLVFGTAATPVRGRFDQIELGIGSDVHISYIADKDGDGLFDREEELLGTSDTDPDGDDDGATAPCPADPTSVAVPCPDGWTKPDYPSDLFEAQVGWDVPFRRGAGAPPGYHVFSSPVTCDGDLDGSPDGTQCPSAQEGPGAPSELGRTTDPSVADTDFDGTGDTQDANPTQRPPRYVDHTFASTELERSGDTSRSGDDVHLGGGGVAATPAVDLCAPARADDIDPTECAASTGYYRVALTLARGAATTATPVLGTVRVTAANSTGLPNTPRDTLLEARLDEPELPLADLFSPKYLYFAIDRDVQDLRVSVQAADGRELTVRGAIAITRVGTVGDPNNRSVFVNEGADVTGRFAGIAYPGWMLAPDAPRSGAQGVQLTAPDAGWAVRTAGPGGAIAARYGVSNVRFGLRVNSPGVGKLVSIGLSGGLLAPTAGADRLLTGDVNEDTGIDPTDMYDVGASRAPLVTGHVYRDDFAQTGATTYFELPYETRAPVQNVSLAAAVTPSAGADTFLDNVVVDPVGDPATQPGTLLSYGGAIGRDDAAIVRQAAVRWSGLGMQPIDSTSEYFNAYRINDGSDPVNDDDGSVVLNGAYLAEGSSNRDRLESRYGWIVNPLYSRFSIDLSRVDSRTCPYSEQQYSEVKVRIPGVQDGQTSTPLRQRDVRSGLGVHTLIIPGIAKGQRGTYLTRPGALNISQEWQPCSNGSSTDHLEAQAPAFRVHRVTLMTRPLEPKPPAAGVP